VDPFVIKGGLVGGLPDQGEKIKEKKEEVTAARFLVGGTTQGGAAGGWRLGGNSAKNYSKIETNAAENPKLIEIPTGVALKAQENAQETS